MISRTLSFFFDIDGTLLPFGLPVPESAKEKIKDLKEMGHHVFLATGRSIAETESVESLGFDGGVYSAGAHVVYHGEDVYRRPLTLKEKAFLKDYGEEMHLLMIMQSDDATYLDEDAGIYFREQTLKYIGRELEIPHFEIVREIDWNKVYNKALFLTKEGTVDEVRRDLAPLFDVVDNTVGLPYSLMAEIVTKGLSKASGISYMMEALGDPISSSVAIGDGANDKEMIEAAGLGIAMGNASKDLKDAADYVARDILDDGLQDAIDWALSQQQK